MIANNSAEASGPSVPCATPGASATRRVSSRSRPLDISSFAPLRNTIAESGELEAAIVRLNPAAIESTPTSTPTTPTIPKRAAATEPRRCGKLNRPNLATDIICEIQLNIMKSVSSQRISHAQPHRSKRGEQSGGNAQGDADSTADEDVAQWKAE